MNKLGLVLDRERSPLQLIYGGRRRASYRLLNRNEGHTKRLPGTSHERGRRILVRKDLLYELNKGEGRSNSWVRLLKSLQASHQGTPTLGREAFADESNPHGLRRDGSYLLYPANALDRVANVRHANNRPDVHLLHKTPLRTMDWRNRLTARKHLSDLTTDEFRGNRPSPFPDLTTFPRK